ETVIIIADLDDRREVRRRFFSDVLRVFLEHFFRPDLDQLRLHIPQQPKIFHAPVSQWPLSSSQRRHPPSITYPYQSLVRLRQPRPEPRLRRRDRPLTRRRKSSRL